MNLTSLYEITSNDKLQVSLGLAIAEARMLPSLLKARESSIKVDREDGSLDRLAQLDREIDYLEAKIKEIHSKTNRSLA